MCPKNHSLEILSSIATTKDSHGINMDVNWQTLERITIIFTLIQLPVTLFRSIKWVTENRQDVQSTFRLIGVGLAFMGLACLPVILVSLFSFGVNLESQKVTETLLSMLVGTTVIVMPSALAVVWVKDADKAINWGTFIGSIIGWLYTATVLVWGLSTSTPFRFRLMIGLAGIIGFVVFSYWQAKYTLFLKNYVVPHIFPQQGN